MTKLIFNADDFGYSNAINYGIIDCFKQGILTSTTFMSNMPGSKHAVELVKENSELGIGVHLTLTCGKSIKNNLKTICDINGNFKNISFYKENFKIDLNELYDEWDLQIKKSIDMGISPTHLDSHHHAHTFGENYKVIIELAKKYCIPIRNNSEKLRTENELLVTEGFINDFDQVGFFEAHEKVDDQIEKFLEEKYKEIISYKSVEVMCHPGYVDEALLKGSSLNIQRLKEVEVLTKSNFMKKILNSKNIQLVNYSGV